MRFVSPRSLPSFLLCLSLVAACDSDDSSDDASSSSGSSGGGSSESGESDTSSTTASSDTSSTTTTDSGSDTADTTGASDTADTTGESESGGDVCAEVGDPCLDCITDACCTELTACYGEDACGCVLDCIEGGGDLETCGTECDVVGAPPQTLQDYFDCTTESTCQDVCGG